MKKLIIGTCLLLVFQIKAQTTYSTTPEDFIAFHSMISTAERMYANDSLLYAYAKFDAAFENYKGAINPTHYAHATIAAIKIKEEYKGLTYLEKAIKAGYVIDSAMMKEIVFYNQNTKKDYKDNNPQWVAERNAAKNIKWEASIIATQTATAKYNTPAYKSATDFCLSCAKNPACNKKTPEYTSKYKLVKEKNNADSVTANKLLADIAKFGFPSLKTLNKKAYDIALGILMNYDQDKNNSKLNELLYKALIDGQISPAYYGQLIDRRNTLNGLAPEFYEPFIGYDKITYKEIAPINKKRKSIGLYEIYIPKPVETKTKPGTTTKAPATKTPATKAAPAEPSVVIPPYIKLYDY